MSLSFSLSVMEGSRGQEHLHWRHGTEGGVGDTGADTGVEGLEWSALGRGGSYADVCVLSAVAGLADPHS